MSDEFSSILQQVGRYYSEKIQAHGPTARGADWNSRESQELRFEQLLKVVRYGGVFSLNDFGCGYGHLFGWLKSKGMDCDYLGLDVSDAMVDKGKELFHEQPHCRFLVGDEFDRIANYSVASGVLNVKLAETTARWTQYALSILDKLAKASSAGFAFNCLTKYSDAEYMREDLYYADPCFLFDYCKTHYSTNVALLHDYGLYEFTILVRM